MQEISIDNNQKSTCPNPKGYYVNIETGDKIPAPCMSPTCSHCGPIYRNRLLDDVAFGSSVIQTNGRRWRFMTLTTGPNSDQDLMSLYFSRFRSTLAKHGYRPDYFRVTEFQQNGQRHFHLLIDVFVPFNFIQYAWRLATDNTAYWVNIKKAQVRQAAAYMFKYMTKQTIFSNQFKKGERRYSFSRHFPRLPKKPSTGRYTFEYHPNNKNLLREMQERLTIVKRNKEEARRKTLELFPDIYNKWRSAYEWRAFDL